jgi:NAD(P)-dependent dehydrogenase (short-subunit alcohol dehydrogenase family)
VIVPADLAGLQPANTDALRAAIDDSFGRLDGLLHNASMLGPKVPIAHYPVDTWREVFKVNVHAVMLLSQALEPLLRVPARASVVLTSSSVGRQGRAYWGAYSASKFAVEGLMQILADEWEHLHIRANSLNPGGTRTAMRSAAYPGEDPATVPTPETHMDLYVHLMSDECTLHGQALDARSWLGP